MSDETPASVAWNHVFEEKLSYRSTSSFRYVVDRTLYRPREIIQFCNQCIELANGEGLVDYSIIGKAEKVYSLSRVDDISAEFRFEYPGLKEIFQTFRGMIYSFTRAGLELHCLEIITGERKCPAAKSWLDNCDEQKLISVLWEVGFIRALAVGGIKADVRSGSRYIGAHQLMGLSLVNINQFTIHPMFHSALALKEK